MGRSHIDGLLESAFRIRPGEARRVGLMFLYLMGVVSTFIVGRTVRDTLFLSRYELSKLPLMYIAVAFSVSAASYVYSRVADRLRRDQLVERSLTTFAAVVLAFWALLATNLAGDWIYPLLYVVIEIVGAISIIQFWTFANDIFSSREAKRLFGIIGAGGVISNVTCGFAIGYVVPWIGAENLLVLCAVLLGACVFAVRGIARLAKAELEQAVKKPKGKSKIGLAADSGTVLGSRHLKLIAGIVAVTFLTVSIIDYQFKVIAKATYTEAELAAYFGYFYGFTGIISSLIQFFGTSRLLERRGIVVALSVLPIGLFAGVLAMLLPVPLLAAATLAKAAENIFRYTVNDASTQLLYVPVPSHQRARAKAFIDGILKPVSIGVAGLILVGLGKLIPKESFAVDLAYIDLAMLCAWIAMVVAIRREYVKSLIDTLHSRRLDLETSWSAINDDSTVKMLKKSLLSSTDDQVIHALELVPVTEADFRVELSQLLAHASKEVRIRALRILATRSTNADAEVVRPLLQSSDREVRAAAIGALCAIAREDAIRDVAPHLSDPDPRVRAASVIALIRHGGLDGVLTAAETLKALLDGEDTEVRIEGARVLAEIKVKSFYHPLLRLLEDDDPRVRLAAVEAAGAMQSPELAPKLVEQLGHRETAEAAIRALASYGASVERTLFRVLESNDTPLEVRRKLPRVISLIGAQQAVTELLAHLDTDDAELRAAIAKAASKIRERVQAVQVDDHVLDVAIRREIHDAYQLLAAAEDLQLPKEALLVDALVARHRVRLGLAFRLLEIRYPARTIQMVYSNLDAESKALRANALEVVDNVLSKDESRLLLPLLEDHTREEKLRAGAELFELERHTPDEWLERLLDDHHPWIVTCSLQLVGERGLVHLSEKVARHLTSTDAIVRETAVLVLGRLLGRGRAIDAAPADEVRRIAERAATDHAPEVRRASQSLLRTLGPAPQAPG
ncbi:HEAT repeat domain-containing protein [Myxococcota bacterium]|nr:HEAT repeat domain-containing protein [Myxococcota bacterium]